MMGRGRVGPEKGVGHLLGRVDFVNAHFIAATTVVVHHISWAAAWADL